MWFVYVLRGVKDGFVHVGTTDDLDRSMAEHASGSVKGTAGRGSLRCELYIALPTRKKAEGLAKYFRTPAGKAVLLKRLVQAG